MHLPDSCIACTGLPILNTHLNFNKNESNFCDTKRYEKSVPEKMFRLKAHLGHLFFRDLRIRVGPVHDGLPFAPQKEIAALSKAIRTRGSLHSRRIPLKHSKPDAFDRYCLPTVNLDIKDCELQPRMATAPVLSWRHYQKLSILLPLGE
jgi:hypothetical protein